MPSSLNGLIVPLWTFLALYGAFLSAFLLYTAFNLYHLLRFGTTSFGLYAVTALFAGGTILLVGLTALALLPYDWSAGISLADLFRQTANTRILQGF